MGPLSRSGSSGCPGPPSPASGPTPLLSEEQGLQLPLQIPEHRPSLAGKEEARSDKGERVSAGGHRGRVRQDWGCCGGGRGGGFFVVAWDTSAF